jgi:hypothetical protein
MKPEKDYSELVKRALDGLHASKDAIKAQPSLSLDLSEGPVIAVKICSHVLDACVWVAFDENFKPDDDEPLAVFYAREIPLLKDKTADELRQIHRIKLSAFPGSKVVQ